MRSALATAGLCVALAAGAQAPTPDTEVPFVVTPDNVTLAMLELAGVGVRDHVIDLGSGDGRIVILAARRFGATGLGVEIVDDLVQRSRRSASLAGVADRVEFRTEDRFKTDLSRATIVTMYLLPEVNLQLRPRLLALAPGTRVVSHDYDLGDWRPDRSVVVDAPDKPVGRDKRSTLHLWIVPARVAGTWCGRGGAAGRTLQLQQRHQHLEARLDDRELAGRVAGTDVALTARTGGSMWLRATAAAAQVGGLTVQVASGRWARLAGTRFERCAGG
jgi:SAM-dependent methyltransferase